MNLIAMDFLSDLGDVLTRFVTESGFAAFFTGDGWKNLIMIAVACVCLYLAIYLLFSCQDFRVFL